MPHWPSPFSQRTINLGLSRIKGLLGDLGNPIVPPVVHVAGTNGKGSILAYLKSIFEEAGYIVHRYTSPHLVRFNERIYVAGSEISDDFLYECAEECRIANGDREVTFFEGTTAIAFLAFSKIKADVTLLETGMGGAYDATNVIPNPVCTIISPISYDHTEYLGESLTQIASEKAGIIKSDTVCIISWQHDEAMQMLQNKCKELNNKVLSFGNEWFLKRTEDGMEISIKDEEYNRYLSKLTEERDLSIQLNVGLSTKNQAVSELAFKNNFSDEYGNIVMRLPHPSLVGLHQFVNASTAAVAAYYLGSTLYPNININSIANGIKKTFWPARMERIKRGVLFNLLPDNIELWLDGAHNSSGAEMISATVSNLEPAKILYVINGMTVGRDVKAFLSYFKNITHMLCCTKVRSEPRAQEAKEIYDKALELGIRSCICSSLHDAIMRCIDDSGGKPSRILICGSLYLAGDVLAANEDLDHGLLY